jgi:uncharacterized protein (TIGR01244 family)
MRVPRTRPSVLVATLIVATLSAPASAQAPGANPASATVRKEAMAGVTNFSRVDATVGCGGATTADAMPALKAAGFTSVINLRQATENGADIDGSRAAAERAGLRYVHLPFSAAQPDPAVVERFLAAVRDPANQPAYIHCASANRVGALWLIKRVKQDGWPLDRAVEEATAIGLTNAALRQFAVDYVKAAPSVH